MKPKYLLKFATIALIIIVSIFILEAKRKTNLVSKTQNFIENSQIEPTINDFIFVESISKSLFVPFTK